jgi:hypothetical protein
VYVFVCKTQLAAKTPPVVPKIGGRRENKRKSGEGKIEEEEEAVENVW